MNVIMVSRRHGEAKSFTFGRKSLILAGFVMTLVMGGAGFAGFWLAAKTGTVASDGTLSPETVTSWENRISEQRAQLEKARKDLGRQVDALTVRLGDMQGRMLRLDALGQRLVEAARLDNGEFDFDSQPPIGGPVEQGEAQSYEVPDLSQMLARLDAQMADREKQLELLDELMANRELESERFVAGRPIKWGWLSSHYGYRTDPFTGKRDWHAGVDLAGKDGSDIIAVAAGVVTWASDRYGYGNLVEIDHGNGLRTRYAHCKEIEVEVGDIVEKGQVVALMGSTGRSTGPHVHFEVRRGGKTLDPEKFIARANR
ncbi:M23 family metallopeptidase [Marinobacteraceae bacterium S3BR75-40.1]